MRCLTAEPAARGSRRCSLSRESGTGTDAGTAAGPKKQSGIIQSQPWPWAGPPSMGQAAPSPRDTGTATGSSEGCPGTRTGGWDGMSQGSGCGATILSQNPGIVWVGKPSRTMESNHSNHSQHCQGPHGITGVGKALQDHEVQPFPAQPRPPHPQAPHPHGMGAPPLPWAAFQGGISPLPQWEHPP